ncbi:trypsin-like peptidase domain-containing protein [Actinoplanes sp. NPDC051861]|uniref:VMAP-C domain-containing protein n=1 Tax=Actinoplanes sp. NPDC051861 TaxID=3155170 RepID=UPI003414CB38
MPEPGIAGAEQQLVKLMKECLVLVSGRLVGSGFLVAPGTVATCAHVAGAPGDEVRVAWRGETRTGIVRAASPLGESKLVPYPDMALVEVSSLPGHPVVWLDDQLPAMSDRLAVFGHGRTFTPAAEPKSGWFTAGGEDGGLIRLTGDEVSHGMSGGPVLNMETGGVCAITKATAYDDPGLPAGGVAVPVRALRQFLEPGPYRAMRRGQETYHRCNRRWTGLAHALPRCGGPVGRRAEAELRAILAQLPETGHEQHLRMFRAVAGDLPDPPRHPLHDHGDVVTELAGLMAADDGFPHVVAYAIEVSRTAEPKLLAELLRQWARLTPRHTRDQDEVVRRLAAERTTPAPAQSRIPSLVVCVRSAGQDQKRFHCELWRYNGPEDVTPIEVEDPDRSIEELRPHLTRRIPELVAGEPGLMIELVLPADLFAETEHVLAATGRRSYALLGETNPVVVRDQERFDEPAELGAEWRQRWDALAGRDMGSALTRVSCLEQRGPRALHAWFQLDRSRAALVLPRPLQAPITRTVMEVGLFCGVPIMIWRRNGCDGEPEKSHQDCRGSRLARAVAEELAGAGRDDVPERILRMRQGAAAEEETEGEPSCGHDVVLLWDDPGRRVPRHRMLSPMGEGHARG